MRKMKLENRADEKNLRSNEKNRRRVANFRIARADFSMTIFDLRAWMRGRVGLDQARGVDIGVTLRGR